jgi:zinc finger CCHC domain-containing protein 8
MSEYPYICPGKLSKNLRAALGMQANELPPYIYKMREAGYPPGWLRAAQKDPGKIRIFNTVGLYTPHLFFQLNVFFSFSKCIYFSIHNVDTEEAVAGEMAEAVDASHIIDYPGFNVLPPKKVKDVSSDPHFSTHSSLAKK